MIHTDPLRTGPLWTGLGLVTPLRARVSGGVPSGVDGVSIDTRTLVPGDLFVAIKGENSDGHDYVRQAFAAGAAAAVRGESWRAWAISAAPPAPARQRASSP